MRTLRLALDVFENEFGGGELNEYGGIPAFQLQNHFRNDRSSMIGSFVLLYSKFWPGMCVCVCVLTLFVYA